MQMVVLARTYFISNSTIVLITYEIAFGRRGITSHMPAVGFTSDSYIGLDRGHKLSYS
jgi:hypothetical protein